MVEDHISKLAPMAYTFLRPVQFMDSYVPTSPYMFKISRTVVMRYTFYKNPQRKHQLISSRDIGCAGAEAFVRGPKWMDGQIGLAGDSLTIKEIDKIFFEVGFVVQALVCVLIKSRGTGSAGHIDIWTDCVGFRDGRSRTS